MFMEYMLLYVTLLCPIKDLLISKVLINVLGYTMCLTGPCKIWVGLSLYIITTVGVPKNKSLSAAFSSCHAEINYGIMYS